MNRTWFWPLVPMTLLATLTVMALVSALCASQTDPPGSGDWVVADTTAVTTRDVVLDGNLTVTSSGHLTLTDVKLKFNCSFPGQYWIRVESGGTLIARDIDHASHTVNDATILSSVNEWAHYTWTCEAGSHLNVSASIVRDCGVRVPFQRGLVVATDDARIENSTFWSCNYGVYVWGSSPVIEDTFVYINDGYGVYVLEGSPSVDRCTFRDNFDAGAFVVNATGARFRNCTFEEHVWSGLYANNSDVRVEDCTFRNNTRYGVNLHEDCRGHVARCRVYDTGYVGVYLGRDSSLDVLDSEVFNVTNRGIWVYRARPLVARSHVHHCANNSVFFYASSPVLRSDTFEQCGQTGVIASDSPDFLMEGCTVRDNGNNGVFVGSLWTGWSQGVLRDCDISGNRRAGVYVYNQSACTIVNGSFADNGQFAVFCTPTAAVSWEVRRAVTVTNETFQLRGNVEVRPGGSLSMESTSVLFDNGEDRNYHIKVTGAVLEVRDGDGDRLTTADASEVSVLDRPSVEERDAGLLAVDGARVRLLNSLFYGTIVSGMDADLEVAGCAFQDALASISLGGQARTVNLTVSDSSFADLHTAIEAHGMDARISGCSFSRCQKGVWFHSAASVVVDNCTFIACLEGMVLDQGPHASLTSVRLLGCFIGLNATRVTGLEVTGCDFKGGGSTGLFLDRVAATVSYSKVTGWGAGGVIVDLSELELVGCTVQGNTRVGIRANETTLSVRSTSITSNQGIGLWADQGELALHDSFLDTSAAWDLEVEGGMDAAAFNSSIEPSEVRVRDTSSFEAWWQLRVTVEVEGGHSPPRPVSLEVEDARGRVYFGGALGADDRTPWKWARGFNVTVGGVTELSPYKVTVTIAGSELEDTFPLAGMTDHTVVVPVTVEAAMVPLDALHEGSPETFDASPSRSFPFAIASWEWDFDAGAAFETDIEGEVVDWTLPGDGRFDMALRVTDTDGNQDVLTLTLEVMDMAPEPSLVTPVPAEVTEDEELVLEGRYSSPYDDVVLQEWTFGDGSKATSASVRHSWSRSGTYEVTFTVLDDDGSSSNLTFDVTVVNEPPQARVPATVLEVNKRTEVVFDGSGSNDTPSDLPTLAFEWDLGTGDGAEGALVSYVFDTASVFQVRLTVTDDDGAWDTLTIAVTVVNRPPVVLQPVPTIRLNDTGPEVIVHLRAYVSDPDGDEAALRVVLPEFERGGAFRDDLRWDEGQGWLLVISPVEGREGRAVFDIRVEDPEGASVSLELDVRVKREPGGPSATTMALAGLAVLLLAVGLAFLLARRRRSGDQGPGG